MDAVERCRRYVGKLEAAISGSGGHNAAIHAACVCVKGFALSQEDALTVMREYNLRCSPAWSEKELLHKVQSAHSMADDRPRGWMLEGNGGREGAAVRQREGWKESGPVREAPKRFLYDIEALRRVQHPGLSVGRRWLLERSFSDVRYVSPGSFLGAVFDRGEKVLAFTNERCQGEWGYVVGQGWVKLLDEWGPQGASGRRKEREPFPAAGRRVSGDGAGPREGRLGVWYLSQPVTGLWHWTEEGRWSRRSWHAVTSWRHMVLESDDAPAELYLNWLVQQPLPVAAIYTSAGKSVHALLRFDGLRSKAAWDAVKDAVMPYFSKVGVDWKTLTAVRLTRLPGCLRRGKMVYEMDPETGKKMERYESYREPRRQELLYLNARPEAVPIMDLPQVRSADEVPGPAGV